MLQVSESEMRNIKNALAAALAWIDNAQLGGGAPSVKAEQVSGASAAPDKEMQMLIDLPGVSINATPRKDGLFQGYAVRDGIKKYLYGKTRAEVVQKIRDYLQYGGAIRKRRVKKKKLPPAPLLREYIGEWAELYKKPNLKPHSYESLQRSIKHINAALGELRLDAITAEDLQRFFNAMGATRTREVCKTHLGQVFAKALATGKIKSNPMLAVEIVQHTAQKRSALTPERQERFMAAIAGTPHGLLARLLLATGLRIGEALALTAADIDAERFTVTVSKDIAHLEDGSVLIQTPKSRAAYRTVPISRELCAELLALPRQGRLFPITYNAVRLAFQRVSGKLGYTVTPHILRHTYATRLEEAGIPPKIKQYLMGHASLRMTQDTYTDTQEHYVASVSDRVRSAFTS